MSDGFFKENMKEDETNLRFLFRPCVCRKPRRLNLRGNVLVHLDVQTEVADCLQSLLIEQLRVVVDRLGRIGSLCYVSS